jgi:thiosulfate reductase cytochrome b subunit
VRYALGRSIRTLGPAEIQAEGPHPREAICHPGAVLFSTQASAALSNRTWGFELRHEAAIGVLRNRTGEAPRRLLIIRITHWIAVLSVLALLVSGAGILISHPRLYWGEVGNVDTESLLDLPIPFIIGPSVWNRPIHFFGAWILVLAGIAYVAGGWITGHFRKDLLPVGADLRWYRIIGQISDHLRWKRANDPWTYNVVQRLTYLVVVFVLFPGIVWTGLAMSFGVTSVFPVLATALGGHQSARTLHFVLAALLVLFLIVHMVMLCLVGFRSHVRAMITGYIPREGSTP